MQLLGRAEVLDAHGQSAKFRSRSAFALLAYICLHDHPVLRVHVEGLLWPDSDLDRQSQNFRRALSDLREVLEPEGTRGTILDVTRDSIGYIAGRIEVDVAQFRALALKSLSGDPTDLVEASDVYAGPLWPNCGEHWIYGLQEEVEELFAQVTDELVQSLVRAGKPREAIRAGRAAVLKAPMREEVHASLVRAYASAGMMVEAIRQFEALESMLDEQWGEAPSAHSREALEQAPVGVPAQAGSLGGALTPGSDLYIERPADDLARQAVANQESIVLIQGPRQVGKTSLLARTNGHARAQGRTVVMTDFQSLSTSQIRDEEQLYRTLADHLIRSVGLDIDLPAVWNSWLGPNSNLDTVVRTTLNQANSDVVWAMDEVDRVFGHECCNDFFGLVRSWHNRRALDPDGPWSRLSILLAYATEAHLFITDLNQSPFNVGVRLRLEDFNLSQVQQLNRNMGAPVSSSVVERVYNLTHGQPFLTRKALDFLGTGSIEELEAIAVSDQGPFGEHLRRLGQVVSKDASVLAAIGQLLKGAPIDDRVRSRLLSGGVARETGATMAFRVPIYGPYLQSVRLI